MPQFNAGGAALWADITESHDLDSAQLAQLEEACRQKDRCDHLHGLALAADPDEYVKLVKVANETSNQMKQLLAALRLPDASGKRPQYRGPRGAQAPSVPGGASVSSIDRARARKKA